VEGSALLFGGVMASLSKETIQRIKTELPDILEKNPVLSLPSIAKQLNICRFSLLIARKKSKAISKMIDKYMEAKFVLAIYGIAKWK